MPTKTFKNGHGIGSLSQESINHRLKVRCGDVRALILSPASAFIPSPVFAASTAFIPALLTPMAPIGLASHIPLLRALFMLLYFW